MRTQTLLLLAGVGKIYDLLKAVLSQLSHPENNSWVGGGLEDIGDMGMRIIHLISTLKEYTAESGAGLGQS